MEQNNTTTKGIFTISLGIATGLGLFYFFESGEISFIRFGVKVLICTFLLFLGKW